MGKILEMLLASHVGPQAANLVALLVLRVISHLGQSAPGSRLRNGRLLGAGSVTADPAAARGRAGQCHAVHLSANVTC